MSHLPEYNSASKRQHHPGIAHERLTLTMFSYQVAFTSIQICIHACAEADCCTSAMHFDCLGCVTKQYMADLHTAHSVPLPPSCCSRCPVSCSLTRDLTACLEAAGAPVAPTPPSASAKEAIKASSSPASQRSLLPELLAWYVVAKLSQPLDVVRRVVYTHRTIPNTCCNCGCSILLIRQPKNH